MSRAAAILRLALLGCASTGALGTTSRAEAPAGAAAPQFAAPGGAATADHSASFTLERVATDVQALTRLAESLPAGELRRDLEKAVAGFGKRLAALRRSFDAEACRSLAADVRGERERVLL